MRVRSDDEGVDLALLPELGRAVDRYFASRGERTHEVEVYGLVMAAFNLGRAAGMRRLAFALGNKPYVPSPNAFHIDIPTDHAVAKLEKAGLN
jgi:hypothetical protein